MGTVSELVLDADDVFAIFRIMLSQCFKYAKFNLALFVKFLPVFQNFKRHHLLLHVIKAPDDDAKSAATQLLLYFVPVVDVVFSLVEVVCLIVVEAVIVDLIGQVSLSRWILVLTGELPINKPTLALKLRIEVDIVNSIERRHLVLLKLRQQLAILVYALFRRHWELGVARLYVCRWAANVLLLE